MGAGLQRVEAPTEFPVTLAEIKEYLAVAHDDDDALLTDLLQEAVDMLDGKYGALQRAIMPQVWAYTLDAWPEGGLIPLPLPPLLEVVKVEYLDEDGAQQTMPAEDYRVDAQREPGWIAVGDNGWPALRDTLNAVTITFRAGYESDGTSGSSPVPPQVRLLVKRLVAHAYEHRGDEEGPAEMPEATQQLIDRLRVYA